MDAYKQTESTTLELKGASVEWPWFQINWADLDLDSGTAST
jgi:hypothetical protein